MSEPFADGREMPVLQPTELLRRLATRVPPPRHHLVRFHTKRDHSCGLLNVEEDLAARSAGAEQLVRLRNLIEGKPAGNARLQHACAQRSGEVGGGRFVGRPGHRVDQREDAR